jgi:cation diffusion facilitator family transporter
MQNVPNMPDSSMAVSPQESRYVAIRNVTLVGVISNVILSVFKIVFGWIGQSQALIADGLHSLSDLISDGVVLVAARFSSQDADAEHPYGHGRFETVATVLVGLILMAVAFGLLWDSIMRVLNPDDLLQPTEITLAIAVVSILLKEALYHYTVYVADQVRSQMLRANAWHHRSDAVSSVVVLIGVAGSMAGAAWLDAVAAMVVAVMIAHIGWSLGGEGLRQLVDTGLARDQVEKIKTLIRHVEGVRTLHALRTRHMGENALVDVHILVNPRISVSEGHHIGDRVRAKLLQQMPEIVDVTVHVDPEDDQHHEASLALPSRHELIGQLQQCWLHIDVAAAIEHISLHYLSGRLNVDIYLPLSVADDLQNVQQLSIEFKLATQQVTEVGEVRVFFS